MSVHQGASWGRGGGHNGHFNGSFVKGALDLLKVRKYFSRAVLRKMNVEGK